jgi:general nucleoside transport system ATP-binding protein
MDGDFLQMQGIGKRFGATVALHNVNFSARKSEIHAILGENGAGKSTLMHILSGLFPPDEGSITLDDQSLRFGSPNDARRAGIAMVHQHFTLVPAFTVAENLALDSPKRGNSFAPFNARRVAADALEYAAKLGWNLDADARVSLLPVGVQQRIEIVKALVTHAPVLIFDEPTAVLSGDEVNELFSVLGKLRDEGRTILLIAHKLAEILAVSDRVTILRRGRNVTTTDTADTTAEQLAAWMIGDAREQGTGDREQDTHTSELARPPDVRRNETTPGIFASRASMPNSKILRVESLSIKNDRKTPAIEGVSFEIKGGEIFGVGGVDGNGQTELAEALAGLRPVERGSILYDGKPFVAGTSPTIGYIPQDRRRAGLATSLSIRENLLLEATQNRTFRKGIFLRKKALDELAQRLVGQFDVRTADASLPASSLSGGNQQKIVAARALEAEPELIVAVNPTRGLDIGATKFVHEQLRLAKQRGALIVLFSTDWDELAALANRAGILASGGLTPYDLMQQDATELGLLLGGATK